VSVETAQQFRQRVSIARRQPTPEAQPVSEPEGVTEVKAPDILGYIGISKAYPQEAKKMAALGRLEQGEPRDILDYITLSGLYPEEAKKWAGEGQRFEAVRSKLESGEPLSLFDAMWLSSRSPETAKAYAEAQRKAEQLTGRVESLQEKLATEQPLDIYDALLLSTRFPTVTKQYKAYQAEKAAYEAKLEKQTAFWTGLGYPQYARYEPLEIPEGQKIKSASETAEGLTVTFKTKYLEQPYVEPSRAGRWGDLKSFAKDIANVKELGTITLTEILLGRAEEAEQLQRKYPFLPMLKTSGGLKAGAGLVSGVESLYAPTPFDLSPQFIVGRGISEAAKFYVAMKAADVVLQSVGELASELGSAVQTHVVQPIQERVPELIEPVKEELRWYGYQIDEFKRRFIEPVKTGFKDILGINDLPKWKGSMAEEALIEQSPWYREYAARQITRGYVDVPDAAKSILGKGVASPQVFEQMPRNYLEGLPFLEEGETRIGIIEPSTIPKGYLEGLPFLEEGEIRTTGFEREISTMPKEYDVGFKLSKELMKRFPQVLKPAEILDIPNLPEYSLKGMEAEATALSFANVLRTGILDPELTSPLESPLTRYLFSNPESPILPPLEALSRPSMLSRLLPQALGIGGYLGSQVLPRAKPSQVVKPTLLQRGILKPSTLSRTILGSKVELGMKVEPSLALQQKQKVALKQELKTVQLQQTTQLSKHILTFQPPRPPRRDEDPWKKLRKRRAAPKGLKMGMQWYEYPIATETQMSRYVLGKAQNRRRQSSGRRKR
jgi:hypothetical protein